MQKGRRYLLLIIIFSFLILLFSITTIIINKDGVRFVLPSVSELHTIYIPVLLKSDQQSPYEKKPIRGVEVYSRPFSEYAENYNGLILKYTIHFTDIIPEPLTQPNWTKPDGIFQNDDRRYGGFQGSPSWMNGNQPTCKLPLPEFWNLWAAIAKEAVSRYDLDYMSVWVEPDVYYIGAEYYFGCIGSDYASGVEYAEFYNFVYSAIKSEYPDLQILAGELADPSQAFFLGFLDTVHEFDGISFHGYTYCSEYSYFDISNKIESIKSLTQDKPVWLSETSVITSLNENSICYENSPAVEQLQVEHYKIVEQDNRLDGFLWFTLNDSGWRYSSMMRRDRLKPVGCYYNQMNECADFAP